MFSVCFISADSDSAGSIERTAAQTLVDEGFGDLDLVRFEHIQHLALEARADLLASMLFQPSPRDLGFFKRLPLLCAVPPEGEVAVR